MQWQGVKTVPPAQDRQQRPPSNMKAIRRRLQSKLTCGTDERLRKVPSVVQDTSLEVLIQRAIEATDRCEGRLLMEPLFTFLLPPVHWPLDHLHTTNHTEGMKNGVRRKDTLLQFRWKNKLFQVSQKKMYDKERSRENRIVRGMILMQFVGAFGRKEHVNNNSVTNKARICKSLSVK